MAARIPGCPGVQASQTIAACKLSDYSHYRVSPDLKVAGQDARLDRDLWSEQMERRSTKVRRACVAGWETCLLARRIALSG
ncbi:MAG TPA: hypothetical protein VMU28_02790 [Terriglobales bacterium]|nr:hypothetical protein [Terriglobales bacterium]